MSPEILGFVLLGALLTGIFVGFPIAFTLIILAIVFGYIGIGPQVFYLMYFQTIGLMVEETLAAVPLFVFMGHMLEQAGLMERLFKSFQFIFARIRGSLYLGVLLTATVFATATGIIDLASSPQYRGWPSSMNPTSISRTISTTICLFGVFIISTH